MEALYSAADSRLKAQWPAGRVYAPNKVPDLAKTPYIVLSMTSPAPVHDTNDANPGPRSYRLVAQCFGSTQAEVDRAAMAVDRAFIGHRLNLSGYRVPPPDPTEIVSSPAPGRDPDAPEGGLLSYSVAIPIFTYPEE